MIDNGYVIPGLNEDWTLMGAKLNEWICGAMAFLMCSELFDKPARAMPILLAILLGVSLGLAAMRRRFPDEEKGMRNYAFMLVGLNPPGLPAPAAMQPVWSGAPISALHVESDFVQLGLEAMLVDGEEHTENVEMN